MLQLTLAKPIQQAADEADGGRLRAHLRRWLMTFWEATVRQAERPGRFVPYC